MTTNSETMSKEGVDVGGMLEYHAEDGVKPDEQLIDTNHGSGENLGKENGLHGHPYTSDSKEHLVQMVVELNFQNEYLKSQFEDMKNLHSESSGSRQQKVAIEQDGGGFEDVKELRAKIEALSRELSEEKQTRGAAEEALKHLRAVYSEADAKAQDLSAKLAEGQLSRISLLSFGSCLDALSFRIIMITFNFQLHNLPIVTP